VASGDHGVVEAVHADRDGAAALDVGLLEQEDPPDRQLLLSADGGRAAGAAAADDHHLDLGVSHIHGSSPIAARRSNQDKFLL